MKLKMWQIDAFADRPFEGNPAAIVPLDAWLDDALMQHIAAENNLAETAFFVKTGEGRFDLRWFAPNREVDLCGHATLASGWIVLETLAPALDEVRFMTRSGELVVRRSGCNGNRMSLPAAPSEPLDTPAGFAEALGKSLAARQPGEILVSAKGGAGAKALIAVWNTPDEIKALSPTADLKDLLMRLNAGSLLATAKGDGAPYDFVSRFFAPYFGVPEDPATGSAHCALAPFWAKRLSKNPLKARQVSPRGGNILCTDEGAQVCIEGNCALYMTAEIAV